MRSSRVTFFFISVGTILSGMVNSAEYGEGCIHDVIGSCNRTNYLKCNTEQATGYVCGCDEEFALEDPEPQDLKYCVPFAQSVGDNCKIFDEGDICQKIPGMCDGTKCVCIPDSVAVGTGCEKKASLNGSCIDIAQCAEILELGGAICAPTGRCICNPTTHLENLRGDKCLEYCYNIGDGCEQASQNQNQCGRIGEGVICNSTNVCGCDRANDYILDSYGLGCLKLADGLGGDCQDSVQCAEIPEFGGAVCSVEMGRCICNLTTHLENLRGDKCLEYCHNIGDGCEQASQNRNQCGRIGEGVICNSTSVCGCDNDYVLDPSGMRCLKLSLGDGCQFGTDMCSQIPGAECNETTQKCQCSSSNATHPNQTECLPFVHDLNSTSCVPNATPDQCYNIDGAECHDIDSRCLCDTNHFQLGEICKSLPTSIQEPCLTDSHCSGIPHTICRNETCTCECDPSLGWEIISNLRCECLQNHGESLNGNECLPIVQKLEGNCSETTQCLNGIGNNSFCQEGRCHCEDEYVGVTVIGRSDRCLPVAPVNGSCEDNAQCEAAMGPEAECIIDQCGCNIGSGILNDHCFGIVHLNDPCTINEECVLGSNVNARCYEDICQCIPGKEELNGKCYGSPLINDPCVDVQECRLSINGSVACVDGICSCGLFATPSTDFSTCAALKLTSKENVLINITLFLVSFNIFKFTF